MLVHPSCARQDTGRPLRGELRPCIAVPNGPLGKCGTKRNAGPNQRHGCRRYFGGCSTKSSILASPKFSSKSPVLLLVAVRLAPSASEARCTEVPLPLLAAAS